MTLPEFFAATAFAGVVFPAIATATALSYQGTSAWLVRMRRRRWTEGKEELLFGWDDSRLPWPTPDDLRAFYLTGAGGIVMDGMPEEITVTADRRRNTPIPYRRADVADRIRRREESSPNFYVVGGAEVCADIVLLAERMFQDADRAVTWFNTLSAELGNTPIGFLEKGGDEAMLTTHLRKLANDHSQEGA